MIPGTSNKLLRQEANSACVSCGHNNSIFTPYPLSAAIYLLDNCSKRCASSTCPHS